MPEGTGPLSPVESQVKTAGRASRLGDAHQPPRHIEDLEHGLAGSRRPEQVGGPPIRARDHDRLRIERTLHHRWLHLVVGAAIETEARGLQVVPHADHLAGIGPRPALQHEGLQIADPAVEALQRLEFRFEPAAGNLQVDRAGERLFRSPDRGGAAVDPVTRATTHPGSPLRLSVKS